MASYNNKQYNTRHSNRYNTPGQFVPAGENTQQQQFTTYTPSRKSSLPGGAGGAGAAGGGGSGGTGGSSAVPPLPQPPLPPNPPANTNPNLQTIQTMDVDMKQIKDDSAGASGAGGDDSQRKPFWMKNKLQGVKKISNKERRRRQNENLRKLLSPKNALMVLNEMLPGEQLTSQFKVEPAPHPTNQYYASKASPNFCADLTLNGHTYKGYGENKLSARNVAAEQAIRDLILQKMNKMHNSEINAQIGSMGVDGEEGEDTLPMIQLASYALHKLFAEWEYEGHKVPQLKPPHSAQSSEECDGGSVSGSHSGGGGGGGSAPRTLPPNASEMHPCMVVAYMRSDTEYRDLAVHGDKPQNLQFTIGLDIDGQTFIGKASNKKEARKQAARVACESLFGVKFTAPPPLPPPMPQANK